MMGLVSVLGGVWLLDDSIVCASILLSALRAASALPHYNTNFQWLGRVILFFQFEALVLLMPCLALAILVPLSFGKVFLSTGTLTTITAVVCPALAEG